jgi:hypothetical protein
MLALSAGPLVLLLVTCDVVHSLVVRPAELPGREAVASLALATLLVCAAVATATVFEAVALWAYSSVTGWVRGRFSTLIAPTLVVVVGSPLLMVLARQAFIGNRYKATPVAVYGPWVVLVLLALVTILGIWLGAQLLAWLVSSPRSQRLGRCLVLLGIVVAFVALVAFDSLWFAGWYPLVHTVLSGASLLIAHVLLVVTILRSPVARTVSAAVTAFVAIAMVAALPVVTVWANQTVRWRAATGTLFASRVISPALRLNVRSPALVELDALPNINSRDLLSNPAVTGVPPALASNGLLITVDALRFDALGLNGSRKGLTPNIDAFFADGQVFERAYSQFASTRGSVRAILESRFRDQPKQGTENLINRLRDYGYQVIAVLPTDVRTFVNLERYNFSHVAFYEDPSTILSVLDRLTKDVPATKRFVWVHLYQPHDPYQPLGEFRSGTGSRELYDGEVRWVDADFARIVASVSVPPSIVVLGADHGEEFGEHGGTLHGRTAYDETLRVPLAIKITGGLPIKRRELVANVDIAPTFLAALGIPIPDEYEGYDLLGRASVASPSRVVYAESVTNAVAALRQEWKWVHWTDFDLWEAYDLRTDPRELHNLADQLRVMDPGRTLIASFELPWHFLPPLRKLGRAEYERWLQGIVTSTSQTSNLGRWAGFQLATTHASDTRARPLLKQALHKEDEPLLKLALMDALGPVEPRERVSMPNPDAMDSGLLMETLRYPEMIADPLGFIRSALGSRAAAVRARAAEQLARTDSSAAVEALTTGSRGDAAVIRGLLVGLTPNASQISLGIFRRFVDNRDVDVRVAALEGVTAQERERAVPLLLERGAVEKSPSVVKVILDGLLALDRDKGLVALRDEIAHPVMSDYARAQLIVHWNVTEEADHLVELFTQSASNGFRQFLFTAVSRLRAPQDVVTKLVQDMNENTFEPTLRADIANYLRKVSSKASNDQDDEAGVSRQE